MEPILVLILTEKPARFDGWQEACVKSGLALRFVSPLIRASDLATEGPMVWVADELEIQRWGLQRLRSLRNESVFARSIGVARVSADGLSTGAEWLKMFDHLVMADQDVQTTVAHLRWAATRPPLVDDASRRVVRLVNHDINNPLTAIRILSEMLLGDIADEMAQTDLKDIMEAADVAAATVESMSLALKASEELNLGTWVATDLGGVLQDVLRRPALVNCVEVLANNGKSDIEGDQALVKSVLTDVLMNARKMTDGRTRVEVTIQGDDTTTRLICHSVEIGIPMEYWEHLTSENGAIYLREKRYPVVPTGLFAAHEIMRLHGGRLQFDLADDGGLQVSCIFPAARRA